MNDHLGPISPNEYDLTCNYSGNTPDGPLCGKPATLHLLFRRTDGYEGGSTACEQHGRWAIDGGWGVIDHHSTVDSACCMPGAMWIAGDPSRCVLDFSGVEPELRAYATAGGKR